MVDSIEKVVYINLANRTDRRAEIEKELSVFPTEKVLRFDAIRHNFGLIGACKSHMAVLELAIANNWKNCLIVEDDATWNKYEQGMAILETLIHAPYDVIILGGIGNSGTNYKASNVQTCTAYVISNHYYHVLLNNFREGLSHLLQSKTRRVDSRYYALDQYWKKLQEPDNWFLIAPSLMYQRPSMSSIEYRDVDYTHMFNL